MALNKFMAATAALALFAGCNTMDRQARDNQSQVDEPSTMGAFSPGESIEQTRNDRGLTGIEGNDYPGVDTMNDGVDGLTVSSTGRPNDQEQRVASPPVDDRRVADLRVGADYQIVEFRQGSHDLSESSKRSIRSLIETARARGEINRIDLAVWSDKAFPTQGKDLAREDRDLVNRRIETMKNFLEDELQVSSVSSYSMAERSNWFARMFNTREAELKSQFAREGAPRDVTPEMFRIVQMRGGPMKSVILITPQDMNRAAE